MCAFIEPQLATRATSLKESIWMRIGALQLAMNDRDRSQDAFERVLSVNPSNLHAMTQMGAVLAKKERYSQAVSYLQRAITSNASCGEAWAVLAHCYLMTNDLPKAYQAYEKALNHLQDPCDPNLWYGIGVLYNRYGSHDNALEAFLAVLRLAPNFERAIEVCFYIGIIYKEQHKLDDAMKYFNKVSMVPNPPPPPLTRADVGFEIGHVHELKQDISKALEMYKVALRENPHHAKTLQKLGWLEHFHNENTREAIGRLQMSLDADQNDAQTWYLLGRVYMALGDFRQAYNAYQQAVIRDGRNATFWCSIGVLYYQMNQYNDAMDAYSRAIKLNPSVSEVWFDLGTLYESCGQTIDAIDSYRRASELAPEKTQIRERLNVLQNSLNQGPGQAQGQPPGSAPQQQAHPQQQQQGMSQPMSSLAALRKNHLPTSQPLLGQQQGPGHSQQQLPSQVMPPPQQPQPQQPGSLPPVPGHSAALHALPNPQLQPLGIRAPAATVSSHGIQQQPIPVLSQMQRPQSAAAHQTPPRHIMQHPLQQPPGQGQGQGSTGFNQVDAPPHGLRSTLPIPHLSTRQDGISQPTSQGSQGATQRAPGIPPPRPNSLLQPLPQLPALPKPLDAPATHPGSVKPGEAPPGENTNNNGNGNGQQPHLPMLKIPGKDGHLERIPSLSRPSIHPIPSLAPLVQGQGDTGKQGGNTDGQNNNNTLGPRLPPAGLASEPGNSVNPPMKSSPLAPLQKLGEHAHGGSTLPPVASVTATLQDNGNGNSSNNNNADRGTTEAEKEKTEGRSKTNGNSNLHPSTNEDAKLLQSMALPTEPKRSLLNAAPLPVASGSNTATASPPVPALPSIPRSAPAPKLNVNINSQELRLGSLGASSLTKLGRANSNNSGTMANAKLPTTLPSPLAQPKHNAPLSAPSGLPAGSSALMASPLSSPKTTPTSQAPHEAQPSSGTETPNVPQSQSLPSLPSLTGKKRLDREGGDGHGTKNNDRDKANSNGNGRTSSDKLPRLKSPIASPRSTDNNNGEKKRDVLGKNENGPEVSIPRSVPISSIAGISDANGERKATSPVDNSNSNSTSERKREVSPGADADKRYKRPRVSEDRREENGERNSSNDKANGKEEEERFTAARHPVPNIPSNAPLPSFRSSRIKMGSKGGNKSPVLGLHLRSAPFKSQRGGERACGKADEDTGNTNTSTSNGTNEEEKGKEAKKEEKNEATENQNPKAKGTTTSTSTPSSPANNNKVAEGKQGTSAAS